MGLKVRIYVAAVGLLGLFGVGFTAISWDAVRVMPVALIILSGASFLTQVYELEILPKWFFSTNVAIAATAVFIGGAPLGVSVMVLSTVPAEILLRWDRVQTGFGKFVAPVVFNTAQLVVSVLVAAVAFDLIELAFPDVEHSYLAMAGSFVVYLLSNNLLVTGVISLESSDSFFQILRAGLANFHLQFLTMGVLAVLMTTLYQLAPAYLLLAFVPLILVYYATNNYLRLRRESDVAFRKITSLLAERDEYTGSHSADVEDLAVKLARTMRLRDRAVEAVRAGAAIHDIGKIAIPDAILKKPGPLTEDEFERMKQHTIVGAEIISNLDIYRDVVPIVRHEHEHWDGSGYPSGLVGESIPIGARIVAVADVYSALTTEREYRPAQGKPLKYSHDEACAILLDMAGAVLDPDLVPRFIEIVAETRVQEAVG